MLQLFGFQIYNKYRHHILEIDLKANKVYQNKIKCIYTLRQATNNNFTFLHNDYFSNREMLRVYKTLEKNKYAKTYILANEQNDFIGFIRIVKKGGHETFYKVKKCDCFISHIFIQKEYRNKGILKEMFSILFPILYSKKINIIRIASDFQNQIAYSAYKKYGFHHIFDSYVYRFLGINLFSLSTKEIPNNEININ